jgi:peroxisomal 2,4-dienoyl-CoA reductase
MQISEPVDVFAPDLLKGQVAFVTGGGTGIGREIARVLGRHGARIAIASRRREVCEETAAELGREGIEVLALQFDVRKSDEVERVTRAILERWGRLDILVNNAAGNFPAPISKISYNGFKSVVDIDLLGTYNCSKAAFEQL